MADDLVNALLQRYGDADPSGRHPDLVNALAQAYATQHAQGATRNRLAGDGVWPTLPPLPDNRPSARPYEPPGPPRIQREVAETISPTMGAYGLTSLGTTAAMDARLGKYDPETLAPLGLAALPLPGAKRAPPRIENPIKVYHGSPHDFDKFDLSKIGTGEGAQAYGHGLYFAENEGVAKSYKGDPGVKLVRALNPFAEVEQKLGHMYEVALHAKPEQFIDAIAPTSRLPDNAQLALKPYRDAADQHLRAVNPSLSPDWAFTSISHIGDDLKPGTSARMVDDLRKQGIHGARYLDQGSRQAQPWIVRHPSGGIGDFPTEQAARAYVAKNPEYTLISPEAQRTNNYVVWTPEIIEILRKYGIAGPAALGAANAMSQEDKPQQ